MGQHRCATAAWNECSEHRRVFGDLVPIEQYSNGDGRHHRSGNPFGSEVSVDRLRRRAQYEATTTTKES